MEVIDLFCRGVTGLVVLWLFCRLTEGARASIGSVDVVLTGRDDVTKYLRREDAAVPFDELVPGRSYEVVLRKSGHRFEGVFSGILKRRAGGEYFAAFQTRPGTIRYLKTRLIRICDPQRRG